MAYCSTTDVYNITDLTTTDIGTAAVTELISYATYQLNADIGVTLHVSLDNTNYFTGDYDNSGTVFTFNYAPIGDLDNDGSVGTTDVEIWYKLNTDDHYTKASGSISAINDHEIGKFTFVSAPQTTCDYIIKYVWFPIPYNHVLIKKACVELTAYMAYCKTNLKDITSYRLGKMEVTKTSRYPSLAGYWERYNQTLGMVRGRTIFRSIDWEMSQKMANELVENLAGAGPGV